jgi:hypothetical protein
MNENTTRLIHFFVSQFRTHNTLSALFYELSKGELRSMKQEISSGKMPRNKLTDLVLALLHTVATPCHRRCSHHDGRCHYRMVIAPASPPPPPPSITPHCRMLEWPPFPSPDRLAIDVSYATPQVHGIVNVALHREYSPGIIFIFFQGGKNLYHV